MVQSTEARAVAQTSTTSVRKANIGSSKDGYCSIGQEDEGQEESFRNPSVRCIQKYMSYLRWERLS